MSLYTTVREIGGSDMTERVSKLSVKRVCWRCCCCCCLKLRGNELYSHLYVFFVYIFCIFVVVVVRIVIFKVTYYMHMCNQISLASPGQQ